MSQHPHDHSHDHDHHQHDGHDHAHGHSRDQPDGLGAERAHVVERGAVLDIGGDVGALLVTTGPEREGAEIELYDEQGTYVMHTEVHARDVAGDQRYAGLFPSVPQGVYLLDVGDGDRVAVSVTGGRVTKVSRIRVAGATPS
jgi:hypothetical protein